MSLLYQKQAIIFVISVHLKTIPMNAKLFPQRSVADYNVWQLAGRLILLAGILMAYSYCFLLTIKSIIKTFS